LTQDPKKIEKYRGIIKFLEHAVRYMAIYPPDHPSVKGVSRRAYDLASEILEDASEISVRVLNGDLLLDDYSFTEPTTYSRNFLKILDDFGVGELYFRKGVSEDEFLALVGILSAKERSEDQFRAMCGKQGVVSIDLGRDGPGPGKGEAPGRGVDRPDLLTGMMKRFFDEVDRGGFPALSEVEELADILMEIPDPGEIFPVRVPEGDEDDPYTPGHSVNVGILSGLLAREESLGEEGARNAALAGLMHDIGKARLSPGIVRKVGLLTPREQEEMKAHPDHSAQVVRRMGAPEDVAKAVEDHHRYFDGGGYPERKTDKALPVLAGIVSVADFFDAATTVRPYRAAMDPAEALEVLSNGSGGRFAPVHVDAMCAMFGPYPPGTVVRLSSNEIGVVVAAGRAEDPSVRMVVDRDGYPFGTRRVLDLGGPEAAGRIVAGVVHPALYGPEVSAAFSFGAQAGRGR
jgi:putative nucleotidyltransferase with HDIG domain